MQWKGPFKVMEKKGSTDYRINVNGTDRLFHINLLKKYHVRVEPEDDMISSSCVMLESEQDESSKAYASRKLLESERRYAVVEKECLAIVWAVQKFQAYLYGKLFVIETDHRPLLYLQKSKVSNSRLMRWSMFLQSYKFRTQIIKGSDNVGADFLSRHAVD